MASENQESGTRVSNSTLATGPQPGQRTVASASPNPAKRALRKLVVVSKYPSRQALDSILDVASGGESLAAFDGPCIPVRLGGTPGLHQRLSGDYDIVFIESMGHAYSNIKRVAPNLVIVHVEMDDMDGFQLLSMLTLDGDTCCIPVMTYTTTP